MTLSQVTIELLAGPGLDTLIGSVIERVDLASPVTVATPNRPPSEFARAACRAIDGESRAIAPPRLASRANVTRVRIDRPGAHLDHVSLPSAFFAGRSTPLANDLTALSPGRPDRDRRVGTIRASPGTVVQSDSVRRPGPPSRRAHRELVAGIHSVVSPALILLRGSLSHSPLLIATGDQIAAELAGRALGALQSDPDLHGAGPWEHPLVQRATELELGVTHPDRLRIVAKWLGAAGDAGETELRTLAARAAETLSVRSVATR